MSDLNVKTTDTMPVKLIKMGLAYYYAGVVMMAVGSIAHCIGNAIEVKKEANKKASEAE